MSGNIPSELGNLISLENLDLRKFLIITCNNLICVLVVNDMLTRYLCYLITLLVFISGDYSLKAIKEGSKRSVGTIPSELGKLKNWKYVVFRKLFHVIKLFICSLSKTCLV